MKKRIIGEILGLLLVIGCAMWLGSGKAWKKAEVASTEADGSIVELTPEVPENKPIEPTEVAPAVNTPAPEEQPTVYNPPAEAPMEQEAYLQEISWEDANNVHTASEYVAHFAGVCPSAQRQSSVFWEHMRFPAALGFQSAWPSPEHFIETYWREWHVHPYSGVEHVSSFANMGFENSLENQSAGLFIDWSDWSVYWEATWQDNRPYSVLVSPTHPASWDATASSMQSYLRSLEQQYHLKCPND